MFIEKKRSAVQPRPLIANGSAHGLVQVADIRGFYVKQIVYLRSNTKPSIQLEIKRFNSLTSFYVGPLPPEGGISKRTDISSYLVADGAVVGADEQSRPGIKPDEHERAVYVEEPIVAKRVIQVDEFGQYYNSTNPLPVTIPDGSINIGAVNAEVQVQLSHKDNNPVPGDIHDSVRIGDGSNELKINPDGSINVSGLESSISNVVYLSNFVNVSDVATEAKVGAVRLSGRKLITMTNKGAQPIYYGPIGVTATSGDILYKDQSVSMLLGDNIGVYVICAVGKTSTVIVQESA